MDHQGSVTNWLDQLKQGEADELQQQLWNRYFEQLVQLARSHLQKDLCRVEDEEDAVLSALNSFFVRLEAGKFPNLNDRTSLWPLLVNITLCKTRNLYRRQSAQKRDVRRTVSGTSSEEENWLDQLAHQAPNQELAVEAAEEASRLLDSLGKESLKEVAQLKLEGYTNAEIAAKVGVMERSIERRLVLIRQTWTEQIEAELN
ncbi:ECF-type sigma factor [Gimesia sp.]|uniref:ECF-type sigma factor n=1 Tax=Gimesia sp. TaxID=2024833 RepID=UPI003A914312